MKHELGSGCTYWKLTHKTKTSLCSGVMSGGFMSASKILPTQNMFPSSCKYEERLRAECVCVKGLGHQMDGAIFDMYGLT